MTVRVPLLLLLLSAATAASAAPLRVMSINVCTDNLLLDLLPPAQITSLSWLARDPTLSLHWREAGTLPVNHGAAEEVLAQHPDLVLAGATTTHATRALLTHLHINLLTVPPAETFPQIRAVTMQVADAVGAHRRGTTLIAEMDATLAALATHPHRTPTVLAWDGAGSAPGPGTLFDAILRAAGGINLSNGRAIDLERVIWSQPDILAQGQSDTTIPGLRAKSLQNPVLRHLYQGRTISYPEALYGCGLPQSAQAAVQLRTALAQPR